jgi:hypothetical protein
MADKKAPKAVGPDAIMAPAEMKPILALSKRGTPISCAIALTKEKEGVILLHKKLKPKKLLAELKKEAADAGLALDPTTLRFGRAEVDVDVDPGLLTLIVNKDAPGAMRPKLLEQVRKAGYKAVEITTDAGLESESEEEDQSAAGQDAADPADTAAATPGSPPPSPPPAGPGLQPTAAPQPPPPSAADAGTPPLGAAAAAPPPGGKQAPADAAALTKELTTLVREMVDFIDHNPARTVTLVRLATEAQISLKQGDLQKVEAGIEALRKALKQPASAGGGAAPAPPRSGQPPAAAVQSGQRPPANGADPAMVQRLKKTGQVWDATIAKMMRDLDQLSKTVTGASNDHELGESFEKEFQTVVEPLVKTVDRQLSDLLHGAAEAGSAEEHQRFLIEVRKAVGQLQKFVQSHPVIEHLDGNPFHPVAIGKTLNASLAAVVNTVL